MSILTGPFTGSDPEPHESGPHASGQGLERVEAHCLEPLPVLQQPQLEVAFANHALVLHRKGVAEQRRRKTLAPDLRFQHLRHFERVVGALQPAVGLDYPQARFLREHFRRGFFE